MRLELEKRKERSPRVKKMIYRNRSRVLKEKEENRDWRCLGENMSERHLRQRGGFSDSLLNWEF